ncbi:MAG: cobyric acid synthase [Treponema sp.]|nr:cobyric acid synthase [Treponema sp.]
MKAKAIMIQGTASSAGKSIIAAGLCRIFKQDGFSVAPFKSQNMALNSFITKEGLEMGRAQVVQAEAAGIEPLCDMNPILLKPTGEKTSQVIVQGEVWRDMDAQKYYGYKKIFMPKVMESYARLSSRHDIIVIEGAGSPAEINLRENDIVNMAVAALAEAPVLLAGDIDRGGVFASLAGTMMLLTGDERSYVKGILINKFRGDKTLLEGGLRRLEEIIYKPVLGVIPYGNFDLDDEDSMSDRFYGENNGVVVVIAVPKFPYISNFTDFNSLSRIAGMGIRYVENVRDLQDADMLILPGTKNTMASLRWLYSTGIAGEIKKLAARGMPVLGICGGLQMLGRTLKDPFGVESGGEMGGLGQLACETVFAAEKTRTRVSGHFGQLSGVLSPLSGLPLEGYEVHMGSTRCTEAQNPPPFARLCVMSSGVKKNDGFFAGNVYGTYVHGVFDSGGAARVLFKILCDKKGVHPGQTESSMSFKEYKDTQYDKLAAHLRSHIDMAAVYRIIDKGIGA